MVVRCRFFPSAVFAVMIAAFCCWADDGMALGIITRADINCTNALVLFAFKDDRVEKYKVIEQNVIAASFSPDGKKVALVKNGGKAENPFGICDITKEPLSVEYGGTIPNMGENNNSLSARIFWSNAEDGVWAYWVEYFEKQKPVLKRINVNTFAKETIVEFDTGFSDHGMSRDITPTSGRLFMRTAIGYSQHVLYEMSWGDGKISQAQMVPGGNCGTSISPDGTIGVRNNDNHSGLYYTSFGGDLTAYPIVNENDDVKKYGFKVNAFKSPGNDDNGLKSNGSRFGANSNDWVITSQHEGMLRNFDLVMYNARLRKQICLTTQAGIGDLGNNSCYPKDIYITSSSEPIDIVYHIAPTKKPAFVMRANSITLPGWLPEKAAIMLIAADGAVVSRAASAHGAVTLETGRLSAGMYVLRIQQGCMLLYSLPFIVHR